MATYEQQRLENIKKNAELLASLDLPTKPLASSPVAPKPPSKKRKAPAAPRIQTATRKSARLEAGPPRGAETLNEDTLAEPKPSLLRDGPAVEIPAGFDEIDWDPDHVAAPPTRDEDGTLRFGDAPHFTPNLTPRQVLEQGAFGGTFFRRHWSTIARRELEPDFSEFAEALEGVDADLEGVDADLLTRDEYEPEVNAYGVKAGQSLADWEKAGWIRPPDFRGWFEWYMRFYAGRRSSDDDRQIKRWLGVAGGRGRFLRSLVKKIAATGGAWDDAAIAPVLRQTLHHWAVVLTADAYREHVA